MGRITRWGFLAAAASVMLSVAVSGCGAGTRENSEFLGAYGQGEWVVRSSGTNDPRYSAQGDFVPEVDAEGKPTGEFVYAGGRTLSFTVDQKGRLLGSFVSETGVTYQLEGELNDDRQFDVSLRGDNGTTATASGFYSPQQVAQADFEGKDAFQPGLAGTFRFRVEGQEYAGDFFASGGNQQAQ